MFATLFPNSLLRYNVSMESLPDLLTLRQAADALNISQTRARNLCYSSRLRAVKMAGVWLIPRDAVEEYQRTRRKPGRPPNSERQNDPAPQ